MDTETLATKPSSQYPYNDSPQHIPIYATQTTKLRATWLQQH